MQDLELITKIQRQLRQLYQNVGDSMISGGVDNIKIQVYVRSGTRLPIYFTGNL